MLDEATQERFWRVLEEEGIPRLLEFVTERAAKAGTSRRGYVCEHPKFVRGKVRRMLVEALGDVPIEWVPDDLVDQIEQEMLRTW